MSVSDSPTPTPITAEQLLSVNELLRDRHEQAVHANGLFSTEYWKHNAGPDWPDVDDDSYQAFENCQHPRCVAARSLDTLQSALAAMTAARDAAKERVEQSNREYNDAQEALDNISYGAEPGTLVERIEHLVEHVVTLRQSLTACEQHQQEMQKAMDRGERFP
jgi:hypothetical protein